MDARITKQRLGNMLSYDWLKILGAIAIAVFALVVLFTMVGTSPSSAQYFKIYGYGDLLQGEDFNNLEKELANREVFSYEVLDVGTECFSDKQYRDTAYSARRAAGEGTVMFVTDIPTLDEEGNVKIPSDLATFGRAGFYRGGERLGFYDTAYYMESCRSYLTRFFGENVAEGALNEAEAKACFEARNNKDKRFRSSAKKQTGIKEEQERLLKLREDYLAVQAAFASGKLSHRAVTDTEGNEYSGGIDVSGLSEIVKLFYREDGDAQTSSGLVLMIFYNNWGKQEDLQFETVSFLRYLVSRYGA